MKVKSILAAVLLIIAIAPSRAAEIGFVEDFALAPDRTVPLAQLIPGTEDFYYYHCLHYQNTEQFDKVDQTLKAWINRYKYTERVYEILNRQALLTFEKNPDKTLAHIINRLNLKFDHQRELLDRKPNLPTALDPALISRETLSKRAMAQYQNLQGFEPAALDWLVGQPLDPDRRRHLLSLVERPDYPNLVKLVVDDLNYKNSGGFGSFNIHRQLLLAQLDECLKLKADLLNQGNFVNTYLAKLHPNADVDWRNDMAEQQAYLDRLWSFVSRLAPVHNSLKAHVLYHQLVLDRSGGTYDRDRFLVYLKLPRPTSYVEPKFMQLEESRRYPCNLNADYSSATLLGPVGDDERLVRSYLMHFFEQAANYKEYEPYVRDDYLKHAFAETKIVNGLGDPEQWYPLLPPATYQQLKDRVDLDFAFNNQQRFAPDAPVSLDLHVKNVSTLIVKVFEINAGNFYREQGREVDTDINLDGLVANEATTYVYADPPLRRVRRHFEFAGLNQRGVYVIDFIGNGKSSRALVRKGKLRYLVRTSTAGQVFTVLDEQNQKLPGATLWLAGHEYQPDEQGEIAVPFTNQPNSQPIVLTHDGFASLETFQHQAENYSLEAGIFADRESLLTRQQASVVIRPSLRLNGEPVTLSILEEVTLRITSTDLDGVSSSKEVADFKLYEDRESTYEFQVPQRLAVISFQLQAKVKNLSQDKKIDLSASQSFQLNQIDRTDKVEDPHLSKIDGSYVVDVLGKSGEPRADRAVQFQIKHRDFREAVSISLQSDATGRIKLGPLADIASLTATGPEGTSHTWPVRHDEYTYDSVINAEVGDTITLPYLGPAGQATRSDLSLLELRGTTFVADRFNALSVKDGMLHVAGLPAGDFDLLLKYANERIRLRLADGETKLGYVLGQHRQLELRGQKPLQIQSIATGGEAVSIKLANATKFTRVHVFATRYEPAYASLDYLGRIRDVEPLMRTLPTQRSAYMAGRNIGDEYRYIIERKYAKKFPGNMLKRPSLLLTPWAIRATETGTQDAAAGESARGAGGATRPGRGAVRRFGGGAGTEGADNFANLDFLGAGSAVLVNLKPNDDGVVEIERELLGPHQEIHVVAVDPLSTTYRSVSLPEVQRELVDLRLIAGLDPAEHFTQQKQISVIAAKQTFEVDDITSARFELYDSLPRVYALYATLSGDAKLAEFSFILNWQKLKPDERRELYSKYACHELNFFLKQKDAEFFDAVIQPYLLNKKDKTFLDRWLLGEDLDGYLKPWSHAQLNVVERILLAQYVAGAAPRTARHVGDLYDLLTPDTERFSFLFDTAVKGRALETGDDYGLADARKDALGQIEQRLARLEQANKLATDPAAPPAGAADPFGEPASKAFAGEALKKAKENAPARQRMREMDGEKANMAKDEDDFEVVEELAEEMYFDSDGDRREQARQFYRKLDKTQEWVENNYYQLPIEQQNADLVTVNGFWRDYAAHDAATPFYSTNLAEASRNFTEMMFALSVLDLPMESGKLETEFAGAKMKLTAGSPAIIFHEQILPSREKAADAPILVSQNFFRHDDRYRYEGNQRLDKYVTEEFLIHTVYGCQVVVTNPTSAPRKLDVLLQIPVGAMPVLGGQPTRTALLDLQPYQTQSLEYYFYFPAAGEFPHYPVQVSQDEKLLAYAQPVTLNVVRQLRNIDRESWDYVSQYGTGGDVIKFLKANNIERFALDLDFIAWRMQDKAFFEDVVRLLAARHVYNETLWSYGLKHGDVPAIREYLQHADGFVQQCGDYLVSPLLVIDPVARKTYEHMDYRPLVNARAHQLGRRRQILNDRLFAQYQRLMKNLTYRRALDDNDLMAVTYYMLLQDRVEEALGYFARVNAQRLETRLQYDYFAAYLDYYRAEPKLAGAVAANYADYPVDRWRNAFTDVAAQLKEIDGGAAVVIDDEDREQKQNQLATTAPSFDFKVESRQVVLNHQNLAAVLVNYYLMDIELLFSSNPFVQSYSGQFSYIRPNLSRTIELAADGNSTAFDLPEQLRNSNVLVEISGGGQVKSQAYYANSLIVQTIENYGQVRVAHAETSKPLSTVYVKVYARLRDGRVKFYKDGYTDLRGRFDYTSLNTNELDFVDRFSILVLSEGHGAIVREAAPPKR